MRILHFPHAYSPAVGGAELLCKRVSEELMAAGHDVHVVTTNVAGVEAYYQYGAKSVASGLDRVDGISVERVEYCNALYYGFSHLARWIPKRARARAWAA